MLDERRQDKRGFNLKFRSKLFPNKPFSRCIKRSLSWDLNFGKWRFGTINDVERKRFQYLLSVTKCHVGTVYIHAVVVANVGI